MARRSLYFLSDVLCHRQQLLRLCTHTNEKTMESKYLEPAARLIIIISLAPTLHDFLPLLPVSMLHRNFSNLSANLRCDFSRLCTRFRSTITAVCFSPSNNLNGWLSFSFYPFSFLTNPTNVILPYNNKKATNLRKDSINIYVDICVPE